jgi:hypothetical protein
VKSGRQGEVGQDNKRSLSCELHTLLIFFRKGNQHVKNLAQKTRVSLDSNNLSRAEEAQVTPPFL